MRIAVAGGTGLLGALVVAELTRHGDDPVVLARSHGVDLTDGTGLDSALDGVEAVVDVANVTTTSRRRSVAFFTSATSQLLAAAARAGAGHVVTLSIVGADTVDFGYYLGKRRQEELLAAGPVPWTLLRATQFHEFAGQLVERSPRPFVVVPRMATRPVAAAEVAAHLVRLAHDAAQGVAQPIAGPEDHDMGDLVRRLLRATGQRRVVVPVRLPGRAGAAMAGGALVPAEPHVRGRQTYAEHLETLTHRS
ncbi:SDR family oxidoreductase [Modestobacter sp. VKM Ac-2979]|uniref:SDR family oxidoreductase n=1 Tax=unclassified Modestobacter TaxID=2643866 RepID=UPI0022AB7B44|nr:MULTISPECIES: SDR family oxidoreductase [unclassified Modestobacter]MCZ2811548.1 SDR family oxidoreductase [Modestobacter sp. VKM Ac-2979]MCZ2843271.1 SDR family oxidoreductase [Modestobacter sp. VKM Ac-2980]